MKVELENVKPMEIEKRSFEIITEELKEQGIAILSAAAGKFWTAARSIPGYR